MGNVFSLFKRVFGSHIQFIGVLSNEPISERRLDILVRETKSEKCSESVGGRPRYRDGSMQRYPQFKFLNIISTDVVFQATLICFVKRQD
jgi:hypothetical protein